MATRRLTASALLWTSRSSIQHSARHIRAIPIPSARLIPATLAKPLTFPSRFYSTENPSSTIYTFTDIQSFIASPSPDRILIDVREPSELQESGWIPGAINVPVKTQPDSWAISDDDFEDRYGFERPGKDTEVVFYCRAGVRSRAAAGLAQEAGWKRVADYTGSWLDWEGNRGVVQRKGDGKGGDAQTTAV